jgi:hypothetical protein
LFILLKNEIEVLKSRIKTEKDESNRNKQTMAELLKAQESAAEEKFDELLREKENVKQRLEQLDEKFKMKSAKVVSKQ